MEEGRMDRNGRRAALEAWGFTVGDRDPRLNTAFKGTKMVVESHEERELPTTCGSDGPWCIVGDDLDALIDQAYEAWADQYDDPPAGAGATGGPVTESTADSRR